jgi:hypothetical protein
MAWAGRLQQNLPPQVLLSDPVVLYDALDGHFAFFLEYITGAEVSTNPQLRIPPVLPILAIHRDHREKNTQHSRRQV